MITNPDFFVVPVDEVGGIELSDAFRKQGLHDRYNGTSPTSGVAVRDFCLVARVKIVLQFETFKLEWLYLSGQVV